MKTQVYVAARICFQQRLKKPQAYLCNEKERNYVNSFSASCIFKFSQPEPILFIEQI